MRPSLRLLLAALGTATASLALPVTANGMPAASAHTDPDVVAVPAGQEATVRLKPTHGCEGSPTVRVAIRAPVAGATAGDVEGWTSSSSPDSDDRTVLEWEGGPLPADQEGAFPVTFTAPDTPGELLTFPSVQECENGEELAWIDGDPNGEYPAPRLLILPPGAEPAETIDDVPQDAPGRDQLVAVVDIDNPNAEEPSTTTTAAPTTTTAPETTTTTLDDQASAAAGSEEDEDGGSSGVWILSGLGVVVLAAVIGGFLWWRRRTATEPPEGQD